MLFDYLLKNIISLKKFIYNLLIFIIKLILKEIIHLLQVILLNVLLIYYIKIYIRKLIKNLSDLFMFKKTLQYIK